MDPLMSAEAAEDPRADPFHCPPKTGKREVAVVLTSGLIGLSVWTALLIHRDQLEQAAAMRALVEALAMPVTTVVVASFGMQWWGTQGPGRWAGMAGRGYRSAWPGRGSLPLDGEG
jgi:hypothetical protein